jgi:hypothetical protein
MTLKDVHATGGKATAIGGSCIVRYKTETTSPSFVLVAGKAAMGSRKDRKNRKELQEKPLRSPQN